MEAAAWSDDKSMFVASLIPRSNDDVFGTGSKYVVGAGPW